MKFTRCSFLPAVALSLLALGTTQAATVNELIQQGRYKAAMEQIAREEGANSPKLAKLRAWVAQESPRNLRKSDTDDVAPAASAPASSAVLSSASGGFTLAQASPSASPAATAPKGPVLSPEDRLELDTIELIARDAFQQPPNSAERKTQIGEFLSRSRKFLERQPDMVKLWKWRANAAVELDLVSEGAEAGANLRRLGLLNSEASDDRTLMATLNRKGWLDPEQAKAALEKEAVVTESRKQLEGWVGNYRCKYFENFMTPGSLNGKLSISITPENKLHISGQGSYFLERKWDDKKPKVITDIDTSSFKIDAIVSPNKNGNIDLPGTYSSSREYQNGYIDNVTRQTYRAFQADSAKLDSVRTATDNDKKNLGSGDLFMSVKYPTQEWFWESMYLFEKVVEGN